MSFRSPVPVSLSLLCLSAFAGPLAGQDTEEDLKILRLRPPAVVLDGVRRVAVVDFEVVGAFPRGTSPGARTAEQLTVALNDAERIRTGFLDEVTGALGQVGSAIGGLFGRGGRDVPPAKPAWASTRVFEVAAGANVQQALRELGVGGGPSLTPGQAQGLRDALTVDALVAGTVTRLDDASDANVMDGNQRCYQREVHIRVALSVIGGDGTVLAAPPAVEGRQSDRKCGPNGRQQLRAEQELLDAAFDQVESGLSNTVAPVFEETELALMKVEGPDEGAAEDAAEQARDGELYEAHGRYLQLFESDAYNPELAYNLGVLNEAVGNFDLAAERYALATELAPDNDRYAESLRRAQNMSGEVAIWQALGLPYQTVEWGGAAGAAIAAGATARTVGRREDRHAVFDEPGSGEAVDQVPGGISVTIVEASGDWVRIRLPGNREVWIARSDIQGG